MFTHRAGKDNPRFSNQEAEKKATTHKYVNWEIIPVEVSITELK